jgi:hypothetical protein
MWMGRATVLLVGLAVKLGLVFGVASAAFGANSGKFVLGKTIAATLITRLAGLMESTARCSRYRTTTPARTTQP